MGMDSNPAKRRKLAHQEPPPSQRTSATMLDTAAATGTVKPSTFVLQTQELLREARIDYDKSFAGAEDLLHCIKSSIEAIKSHGQIPIHQASTVLEKKHNVIVPFPDPKPPEESPYKVSYAKPSQFNVVGSYVSRTMTKSQARRAIDMIVEMPRDIFQDKDYLNLRYFYKRAYYLATVTASVREAIGTSIAFAYEFANGNRLLPVLALTCTNVCKSRLGYQIRIIPCAPEGLFPSQKLLPTSCCIRSASAADGTIQTSTPFYNATLKAESCYLSYLKVLRQTEKACPAFRDACILGRIWLQQRGLGGAILDGGFGHFEWALLTALLFQSSGRKGVAALSPSLSSTQIFKALIQYLATTDLCRKPLIFGSAGESLDISRENGPITFDAFRQLNFAYKMSSWSASMLQNYAKWTYKSLADQGADQFNSTFIIKADLPLECFDLLVRVERIQQTAESPIEHYRGDSWAYCDKIVRVLTKALGDRVQLIHARSLEDADITIWKPESFPPSDAQAIMVGIILNAANATRQVDHGPTVEDKEAAKKFRQFWGEQAELRRFKDGSILESLIWTQNSPMGLTEEIIRYILKLHLHLFDDDLKFHGKGFTAIIPILSSDKTSFQSSRQSFTIFEKDLRDLSDLPLQVRQVAAAAPELRFASIRPPSAASPKVPVYPMDTVLYFEASGKWPENLAAIQRTKIAFLLKIADLLVDSKPEVSCRIGLEESREEIENLAFLDVSYEQGATFRLRIHSDLEESLLERRTKDKTLDQRVRTQGAQLLASFSRAYMRLPLHTQTISSLCSQFPALSSTIRLVKHWFDSHRLSCHFLEEMIELLALKVFLEPSPWQTPSSAVTGLLRTLQFVARWDWRTDPLILDLSGTFPDLQRSDVETRLEAWRKIDPSMGHTALFVATSHDTSGTAYTINEGRPFPSKVVAARMTALARSAYKLVREKGMELEPNALFQPSFKDFDVLIHLNGKPLGATACGGNGHKQSRFQNLNERTSKMSQTIVQQPPRAFLKQLETLFSGPLLLFHGAPDDTVIAGIWNPHIRCRIFRVNLPCSFQPTRLPEGGDIEGDKWVDVNREGMIAEIARIGGDCIKRIDLL